MKYPIAMTVLQYLIFPNFTREFLKLFRARVVGQGKEILSEKSVRPKVLGAKPKQEGKKGGGWGGTPRRSRFATLRGKNFCPHCQHLRPASVPVPFEQEKSGRGVWGEFRFSFAQSK